MNFGRHLFRLPVQITPDEQQAITHYVRQLGGITPFVSESPNLYVWQTMILRGLDREKLDPELVQEFTATKRSLEFSLRHRTDLPWKWVDTPITAIVKAKLEALAPYCRKLSRVQVLLQRPLIALPAHTDKIAGQNYEGETYVPFESRFFEPTDIHARNQYLTIKIPLSEIPSTNGKPFLESDGKIFLYDPEGYAFAIDEFNILHGAQAVAHVRGVLLIDGEYDVERMRADAQPMWMEEFKKNEIFRRVMIVSRPAPVSSSHVKKLNVDRFDLQSIYEDYKVMRLADAAFLGAVVRFSENGANYVKHEYWNSEVEYGQFYQKNKAYITAMVHIFDEEGKATQVHAERRGEKIRYNDLSEIDKNAIMARNFIVVRER